MQPILRLTSRADATTDNDKPLRKKLKTIPQRRDESMSIATIHETIRLIRNPNRVAELALEYAHHSTSESRHWDKLANVLARKSLEVGKREMIENFAYHFLLHGALTLPQIQTLNGIFASEQENSALTVPCPWCLARANAPCNGKKAPTIKNYHPERFSLFWTLAKWPPRFAALVVLDRLNFDGDGRTAWHPDMTYGLSAHDELAAVGLQYKSREKSVSPKCGKTAHERVEILRQSIIKNDAMVLHTAAE